MTVETKVESTAVVSNQKDVTVTDNSNVVEESPVIVVNDHEGDNAVEGVDVERLELNQSKVYSALPLSPVVVEPNVQFAESSDSIDFTVEDEKKTAEVDVVPVVEETPEDETKNVESEVSETNLEVTPVVAVAVVTSDSEEKTEEPKVEEEVETVEEPKNVEEESEHVDEPKKVEEESENVETDKIEDGNVDEVVDEKVETEQVVSQPIIGDKVKTVYGVGAIVEVREDDICKIEIENWVLSGDSKVFVFMDKSTVVDLEGSDATKIEVEQVEVEEVKKDLVGSKVDTVYGSGSIIEVREDDICKVEIESWVLSGNSKVYVFMHKDVVDVKQDVEPEVEVEVSSELVVGEKVKTVYGQGSVIEVREDNICKIEIDSWTLSNNSKVYVYMNRVAVAELEREAVSTTTNEVEVAVTTDEVEVDVVVEEDVKTGDKIKTVYGEGSIVEIREDEICKIQIENWVLSGDSKVYVFMHKDAVQPLVEKKEKTVSETEDPIESKKAKEEKDTATGSCCCIM